MSELVQFDMLLFTDGILLALTTRHTKMQSYTIFSMLLKTQDKQSVKVVWTSTVGQREHEMPPGLRPSLETLAAVAWRLELRQN